MENEINKRTVIADDKLLTRMQRYKKYRLLGYSKYTSARKAGYSHNTARSAKQSIESQPTFQYWMERVGITDNFLAGKIIEGLHAKKIHGTEDNFIEIPDFHARHKYLETALKAGNKLDKGDKSGSATEHKTYVVVQFGKPEHDTDPRVRKLDASMAT